MSDIFDHELDAWDSYERAEEEGYLFKSSYRNKTYKRRSTQMSSDVELEVTFVYATEKAILVDGGEGEVWLPKSQLVDWDDDVEYQKGEVIDITIPEWLALKTDLFDG